MRQYAYIMNCFNAILLEVIVVAATFAAGYELRRNRRNAGSKLYGRLPHSDSVLCRRKIHRRKDSSQETGRASGSGHTTCRNHDILIQAGMKEPKVPA